MKADSTLLLRLTVIFIGIVVLALCVFALPTLLLSDQTGHYRPILLGMYVTALPFFVSIYQVLKLLRYIDTNQAFSESSVRALKNIKYCAYTISALYAVGLPYIFYVADNDDAPGVFAIGLVIVGASFVVATAAAVFQKLFQNAVDIKNENDLTV